MDEDKLADLFRAVVADPPPASFDERDVAAQAGRVTARRRSMLIGAGGLAVVVLAVGVLLGTGVFGHTANLVAGDLLFTKNGRSLRRPWALMTLAQVHFEYPGLSPRAYRRR